MHVQRENVIILGSGPAGYTAAIYAARAMLRPLLISGQQPGGQLTITSDVENYPGFSDPISGTLLMEQMRLQALRVDTRILDVYAVSVALADRPFRVTLSDDTVLSCDSLIICTGAKARWLNLPSEEIFKGFGVSACATCDGFFYRGKKVMVIGGGNTALEEALFLSRFASEVTIVHRGTSFRAEKILQNRLFKNPKIGVKWGHVLEEVRGTDQPRSVTGAVLRNVENGVLEHFEIDGIFIAIGHAPETGLFKDQIKMSSTGYLLTAPHSTRTSCDGVFAAGDVTDDIFRQAVTAAGMGCMAALECHKFLSQTS